jgi:hypothetical protein
MYTVTSDQDCTTVQYVLSRVTRIVLLYVLSQVTRILLLYMYILSQVTRIVLLFVLSQVTRIVLLSQETRIVLLYVQYCHKRPGLYYCMYSTVTSDQDCIYVLLQMAGIALCM